MPYDNDDVLDGAGSSSDDNGEDSADVLDDSE
jgi:hypothetical protein